MSLVSIVMISSSIQTRHISPAWVFLFFVVDSREALYRGRTELTTSRFLSRCFRFPGRESHGGVALFTEHFLPNAANKSPEWNTRGDHPAKQIVYDYRSAAAAVRADAARTFHRPLGAGEYRADGGDASPDGMQDRRLPWAFSASRLSLPSSFPPSSPPSSALVISRCTVRMAFSIYPGMALSRSRADT